MKKILSAIRQRAPSDLLTISLCAILSACAATSVYTAPQQSEPAYVQACAAYGAAFSSALQLRIAGKLNQSQVDQVTLIDSQVTPICTGPLPADPTAAAQKITIAITSLTILEAAQKVSN